jgi:hypothetical protein
MFCSWERNERGAVEEKVISTRAVWTREDAGIGKAKDQMVILLSTCIWLRLSTMEGMGSIEAIEGIGNIGIIQSVVGSTSLFGSLRHRRSCRLAYTSRSWDAHGAVA